MPLPGQGSALIPRRGYIACSVALSGTPTSLQALIQALGGVYAQIAGAFREVQIQCSAESTKDAWLGNANVGTSIGGVVQKGVDLPTLGSTTYRSNHSNSVYINSIFAVWSASGTVVLNIQLLEE